VDPVWGLLFAGTLAKAPVSGDQRRKFWGRCKRIMVRWAGPILIAFGATTGGYAFTVAKGVLSAPGKVETLTDQVMELRGDFIGVKSAADSAIRGQSIETSWQCLRLAKADTSLFRASKTACGEAFHRSRLDTDIWDTLIRPKRSLP